MVLQQNCFVLGMNCVLMASNFFFAFCTLAALSFILLSAILSLLLFSSSSIVEDTWTSVTSASSCRKSVNSDSVNFTRDSNIAKSSVRVLISVVVFEERDFQASLIRV